MTGQTWSCARLTEWLGRSACHQIKWTRKIQEIPSYLSNASLDVRDARQPAHIDLPSGTATAIHADWSCSGSRSSSQLSSSSKVRALLCSGPSIASYKIAYTAFVSGCEAKKSSPQSKQASCSFRMLNRYPCKYQEAPQKNIPRNRGLGE